MILQIRTCVCLCKRKCIWIFVSACVCVCKGLPPPPFQEDIILRIITKGNGAGGGGGGWIKFTSFTSGPDTSNFQHPATPPTHTHKHLLKILTC